MMVSSILKWSIVISKSSMLLSFLVCVITGIFFGYYPAQKAKLADGNDMSIDTSLEKFSSDDFLPEKFREDETRLANSLLPHLSSSFK